MSVCGLHKPPFRSQHVSRSPATRDTMAADALQHAARLYAAPMVHLLLGSGLCTAADVVGAVAGMLADLRRRFQAPFKPVRPVLQALLGWRGLSREFLDASADGRVLDIALF